MKNKTLRPILRYYGGKWQIAPWILSFFPPHLVYVEPYGGAASVLLQKQPSAGEIYNDLDGEIVNLFRVVRQKGKLLKKRLWATPYSRQELQQAYKASRSPVEQARRTVIKSFMGHGSDSIFRQSGFRNHIKNGYGVNSGPEWVNYINNLEAIVERLRAVVIENRPALQVIEQYSRPDTLFYVDPPYVKATRAHSDRYRMEIDDAEHTKLARVLKATPAKVIVSGYNCELYDKLYAGWHKESKAVKIKGADRTENIWMNFNKNKTLF